MNLIRHETPEEQKEIIKIEKLKVRTNGGLRIVRSMVTNRGRFSPMDVIEELAAWKRLEDLGTLDEDGTVQFKTWTRLANRALSSLKV